MDKGRPSDRRSADNIGAFPAGRAEKLPGGSPSRSPRKPAPTSASLLPTSASTLKTQRLLDQRKQPASAFIASTQSMGLGSSTSSTASASWCEGMPSPIAFAKNKPTSKADAAVLNRWITGILDRYAEKMAAGQETPLLQTVDELVPLLSLGLHELTRQVSQQCAERGVVLEKIWRTYVELFDKSLVETRTMLNYHRGRTQRVEEALRSTRDLVAEMTIKNPEQRGRLAESLRSKFWQRHDELQTKLSNLKKDNKLLQRLMDEHVENRRMWFPLFDKYKASPARAILRDTKPELPNSTTPDARIAADFKRILSVMPMEARRRVGFFISSLLGLRPTELVEETDLDIVTEWKAHNDWHIKTLEHRVQELRHKKELRHQAALQAFQKEQASP